ncbi:hypothetical protein M0208_14950 [Sphingomonas sp. SUN019]|uniref:hypothetical protein n=1 Tax=Sphingomonas sp. SUN019 TaxID=2937788 RepID=UPI00216412F6|nr:hypothetical protein [Sphingomonas sp. SUN019]UVO51742.1 hypothetical protein M0208_14950 [Sphingomonas sp. SUN019]
MKQRVLLYGATGRSGRLLAAALCDLADRLVLGGRDAAALLALAGHLRLEARVLGADGDIADGLDDIGLVVNAAGPFARTAEPAIEACVRTRTDYMDIAGEWPVFAHALARDQEAADADTMLLPGIGFAIAATDGALALAAARFPDATRLRLAMSTPHGLSRGSRATLRAMNDSAVRVRRDGVLRRHSAGTLWRAFDFGDGPTRAVAVSWPDIVTVAHSIGVETLEVYSATGFLGELAIRAGALAAPLVRELSAGHSSIADPSLELHDMILVAEAEDRWRRTARVMLRTRDGYTTTTLTAAAAVRAWLAGTRRAGFQTPSRLFGPEFVLACGAAAIVEPPG